MIKKIILSALLWSSLEAFAQQKREFKIYMNDQTNVLDIKAKSNLTFAFNTQYPFFASADGYKTKREVNLEVANNETTTIIAKAGEIKVNSNWIKGKSLKRINHELKNALIKNWSFYKTKQQKGYKLTFISKDPNLDPVVRQNLIDTYFEIYPTLVKTFNKQSTKDVLFVVDTAYKAVAEASGNRILFSAAYLKAHPTDIDVVTHETMHIVQGYGYSAGPVWLTEGIADFVRYQYGVDNVGSKWSLPAFNEKQNYTNSYRITARFFAWLEENIKLGLIASLDEELRAHQYTTQSWAKLTGKSLDQLWEGYSKNPDQVVLKYSEKNQN